MSKVKIVKITILAVTTKVGLKVTANYKSVYAEPYR
jgi:hypothetical protein